jgi:uncharacterized protein
MRLTDDRPTGLLLVHAYSPGEIRIGETRLTRSVLLARDRLIADWRPQRVAELTASDLEPIIALEPALVVIGTGTRQQFPAHELLATLLMRGIGCEVMDTGTACGTYNLLASEDRRVVAALLLAD